MAIFSEYPRFCAACGKRNMVTPSSYAKGNVCGDACQQMLENRHTRSIMGLPREEVPIPAPQFLRALARKLEDGHDTTQPDVRTLREIADRLEDN